MKTRTNAEWLRELKASGGDQAEAISDLRAFLLRAALYTLSRHPELASSAIQQVAEDATQEALIAILKHLDEFRSESKFTTFAFKFAVNFALVAARRERWKNVSLDELLDGTVPNAIPEHPTGSNPDRAALQSEAWATIREIIDHDLTERQRQALEAIVFGDVPLDEVARRWGSNRNATYKLLHDARRKLKTQLYARGYELGDLLELFRDHQ